MSSALDFLVELGTEELPPLALPELERAFAEGLRTGLQEAALTGGPLSLMACAGCCVARSRTRTASRRGVANGSSCAWLRPASFRPPRMPSANEFISSFSASGGNSSVPSSTRKSRVSTLLMPAPCWWPASESRALRGCRSRPAPRRAPWCARAGCSAAARSPRSPCGHQAG